MQDRFTDRVRKVIYYARDEAARLADRVELESRLLRQLESATDESAVAPRPGGKP